MFYKNAFGRQIGLRYRNMEYLAFVLSISVYAPSHVCVTTYAIFEGEMFADTFIKMLIYLGAYVKHGGGIEQQISSYILHYQHLSVFLCQG